VGAYFWHGTSTSRPQSVWQAGLAQAGDEMIAHGIVTQRLCGYPVADGEVRAC
jgi:hypothetical protein